MVHQLLQEIPLPEQQARLVSASLKAFANKGYMDTSVQEIVTLARTSKSTFYKYYKNKEAMLVHIFQIVATILVSRVENSLSACPPTSERTYQAIKTYIDTCFTYRDLAKLILVETVGLFPEVEAMREKLIDYFVHIFQRELLVSPRHEDTKWVVSHAMVGAVNQVVLQSLMLEVLPSSHLLATILEQMLSKILRDETLFSSKKKE